MLLSRHRNDPGQSPETSPTLVSNLACCLFSPLLDDENIVEQQRWSTESMRQTDEEIDTAAADTCQKHMQTVQTDMNTRCVREMLDHVTGIGRPQTSVIRVFAHRLLGR